MPVFTRREFASLSLSLSLSLSDFEKLRLAALDCAKEPCDEMRNLFLNPEQQRRGQDPFDELR